MIKLAILICLLIAGSATANNIPEEIVGTTVTGNTITARRVPGDFQYIEPSFSPDGQQFVYVRRWTGLWIANLDGSNQVLLQEPTKPLNMFAYPRWSPDGSRIAYNAAVGHDGEAGRTSIWYVDIATRQATRVLPKLKLHGVWQSSCAWSPDGSRIAVTVPNDTESRIVIFELSSGKTTELKPRLKELKFPDWSPDGKHILVGGDRHDKGELWLVPTSGDHAKPLDTDGVGGTIGRYSPDGAWVAFQANSLVDTIQDQRPRIALVSSKGGTPFDVVPKDIFGENISFSMVQMPTWSPDSQSILVEFRQVQNAEAVAKSKINTLAVADTSGGNFRVLVDDEPDLSVWARTSWSPNERTIAYTRTTKEDTTVCIVDLKTGTSDSLTSGREPTWSPYGNEIAFSRGGNIWSRNMQTGQEFQITLNLQNATRPLWSPAGNLIAFKQDREIWLVSAYGGESDRLAEFAGLINWASDGSALYGHSKNSNDYEGIWGDVWIYPLADKPDAGRTWGGSQGHVPFVAADGSFVVSFHAVLGSGLIMQAPREKIGRIFFDSPDERIPCFPTVSPSRSQVAFFLAEDFWDPTVWILELNNVLNGNNDLP